MTVVAGADRLLSELEARARAEVEAVRAEARAELERIHAAAAEQCVELRRSAAATCATELAPSHAAARLAARQAARRTVLAAQHAIVRRVLDAVPTVACDLDTSCDTPDSVVRARVLDALSCIGARASELRCAPAILDRVQAALGARSDVHVAADTAISAGIRIASTDGGVVVDDTLEAWLARDAASLAISIRDAIVKATDAPAQPAPTELVHA